MLAAQQAIPPEFEHQHSEDSLVSTYFVNLKVSVDFSDGGAGAQAAHDCDQVSGGDLALALLVVQREALLELCEWENKTGKEEGFPVRP